MSYTINDRSLDRSKTSKQDISKRFWKETIVSNEKHHDFLIETETKTRIIEENIVYLCGLQKDNYKKINIYEEFCTGT